MKRFRRCLTILIAGGCFGLLHASSYTFSIFGPNDYDYRLLSSNGINNQGEIIGFGLPDNGPDGFLRTPSGTFSEFGVPGSNLTEPFALNDFGNIAGTYYDGSGQHAFVRQANGTYTTLQIPYVAFGFQPLTFERASATGINDAGQVIGTFEAGQSGTQAAYNESFIVNPDGTFELLDLSNNTYVSAISNNGYILGSYVPPGSNGSALIVMNSSGQIIANLSYNPLGISNGVLAGLSSINDNGDVIGSYDAPHGSFIENIFSGQATSLALPIGCGADSINDEEDLAGACSNYAPAYGFNIYGDVGFELTPAPVPEPGTIASTLGAMGLCGVVVWRRRSSKH